jgi:hypothetical protein
MVIPFLIEELKKLADINVATTWPDASTFTVLCKVASGRTVAMQGPKSFERTTLFAQGTIPRAEFFAKSVSLT